jgi:competence protein ComFB
LYGVTEKGRLYIKINQLGAQFKIDVSNQLIKAIDKVSLNIKHI